ncbi:ABC transporter ATP-binding protein/permease [Roseomonas sp. OT10]|uniref:ABC transporter ATP-binding protein n=1 Tax=Roseomonas cutis TaxID=2897332 RepID=UPI001E51F6AB|nr:ABC transporter ATP-binding protein [Roseomonas sp. OT10]UFN49427.1 ABC transporter ATP-binding protein/permease [Roseomonas sp. OT10]
MTDSRNAARAANPFRAVLAFVLRGWGRQRGLVLAIAAAMIASTGTDVLVPLYAGRLVEAAANPDRDAALATALQALAMLTGLGVAGLVLRHLAFLTIVRMTLRAMTEAAEGAFHRVQRLSADWHASSFAGSTVRQVTRGMYALDLLHDTVLVALLPSLTMLLGATLLLGWRWPVMGLVVALGSAGYVAATAWLSLRWVSPAAQRSNAWDTRLGGALSDAVGANAVVKAFGAEEREEARLSRILRVWRFATNITWWRATLSGTAQTAALVLLRVAVIGTALWLWWHGQAGLGDLATVLTMFFVVQGYLRDVGYHINNLRRAVNDMEEMVALHAQPLGVPDRPGAVPIAIEDGRIEFRQVGFRYGGHATPLYRDLSLTIAAGERVGLVGHSGSGKTTFVKLIQRLHDVTEGRILIDGQDIAGVTQESLRRQVAIVQQEPVLFHRSLAENIAYARPGAPLREIEAAARLANAHGFITRLPEGYGTLVGERGVKLSGGERQRVALARAFLADAPILILDEATASLDSESEAAIQEAMGRLMVGRTTLVIAHRLSTVRALDRILVFDAGHVVEEGRHEALVRREGGLYRRLFERQALDLAQGLGR